jgi:hypothetical protein
MEKMTQEEIDKLMALLLSGDTETKSTRSKDEEESMKRKYRSLLAAYGRYEFALTNKSFEEAREAWQYVHYEAHTLWLANHGFKSRDEFKQYVKRLLASRR